MSPAVPPEAHAKVLCRRRKRRKNGGKMRHRHREATANNSNAPEVHRREVYLASVQIKPVMFTLFRCAPIEFFISCCDRVTAPRAVAWAPLPSACDAQRAVQRASAWAPRSSTCEKQRENGLGTTIKYLRRTKSGAVGSGLYTPKTSLLAVFLEAKLDPPDTPKTRTSRFSLFLENPVLDLAETLFSCSSK